MRVGFAVGAFVWACANLEISSFHALRKHTANVFEDLDKLINNTFDGLEREFNYIKQTYDTMKSIDLKPHTIGRMLGDMFFNERILTSKHLNLIQKDYMTSGRGNPGNLYDFNMAVTASMRKDHPYLIVGRHAKTRKYLLQRLEDFKS